MDFSPYIAILKDSFFSNLILTLSEEVAMKAVFSFGGYNYSLVALFYVFGSVLGLTGTYLLFRLLPRIFKKYNNTDSYRSFKEVVNRFSIVFFALTALPFAGFTMIVPVFAGLAETSVKRFVILTLIYKTLYIITLVLIKGSNN
jgi:membrane protein YqaA with SNARE-associated domain